MFRDTNNTGTTVLRNMEKMENECPTKQIKSVQVVTIACSCEARLRLSADVSQILWSTPVRVM